MLGVTCDFSAPARHALVVLCVMVSGCLSLAACTPAVVNTSPQSGAETPKAGAGRAEKFLIVDCLLPPRIKQLGRQLTFLEARRAIKSSAQECEIRGGEYVSYDRSDLRTSLHVWLEQAKSGDQQAQTYVGEIFEKGLGVPPDYATAAQWYRQAAEQGYERAQINLGHLYEKGLGVARDSQQALQWYRKAAGITEALATDAIALNGGDYRWNNPQLRAETAALQQEVERWKRESTSLRDQLARVQGEAEQARQALQQRQSDLAAVQSQTEQIRRELAQKQQVAAGAAQDATARERLEQQLQQREGELARQQQAMAQLRQDVARLEADATRQREQLGKIETQQQQVVIAPPSIEIIDPPLMASGTRGLSIAKVSAGLPGQNRLIIGKVLSPAGLLSLLVNDVQQQIGDNGLFRTSIPIQRTNVPVSVVAIDKHGKRSSLEFQLAVNNPQALAAPQPEPMQNAEFGTYYALVIGNRDYRDWQDLATPEHDAQSMAAVLKQHYGFETEVLLNANRFDILQAFNKLRQNLTEQSSLLIYYAGHGYWDEQISRGYWIPVDGHTDSNVNWISTVAITDMLSAMPTKHVLVVADSCYAGALTRSSLVRLDAANTEKARDHWLRVILQKRSRTVLTAGGLQPVLDSGGGEHSVFAKALIDALRENTEILEGQRLYKEVDARVAYAAASLLTEQVPEYAPIQHAGHEAGDFIFVPVSVTQ